jgi:hypothetical protein
VLLRVAFIAVAARRTLRTAGGTEMDNHQLYGTALLAAISGAMVATDLLE